MGKTSTLTQAGSSMILTGHLYTEFVAWIDRSDKTARTYLTNLRQFMAWLKYAQVSQPSRQDVVNYRDWLSKEHDAIQLTPNAAAGWEYRLDKTGQRVQIVCKPSTVAQYLRSVCQFFRWTAANGYYPDIASNIHTPKVRHDTHRKDALSPADVLTIERSITASAADKEKTASTAKKDRAGKLQRSTEQGKRLYAMYLLAVTAGLRTVEISRANVKDLESKGGKTWLYVWGKGHTEPDQKKPIAPEVAQAIRDYLQARNDHPTGQSPLFVSTGNRSGGKRIAPTTISTMLKRAMQAAGYDSERITAHSLRHTAGTAVQEITGDLYTTQKYMRHSNPATTEIYLHTDTEQAESDIAQQLYNLYHGTTASSPRESLEVILNRLRPAQLEQLEQIAKAMA